MRVKIIAKLSLPKDAGEILNTTSKITWVVSKRNKTSLQLRLKKLSEDSPAFGVLLNQHCLSSIEF